MAALGNRCGGPYLPEGQVTTIVKPARIIEVMNIFQLSDTDHRIPGTEIVNGIPNRYLHASPYRARKALPCQGFRIEHKTCPSRELIRIVTYFANDVPLLVVNKKGYVVCGKPGTDPALEAAVAKHKEEE
jgi:hypothetical protein